MFRFISFIVLASILAQNVYSFAFNKPFIQKTTLLRAKQGFVVIKDENETVDEMERRLNQFIEESGDLETMQRQKIFEPNLHKRRRKRQNRIYYEAVNRREKKEHLEEYGHWRPYQYDI